MTAGYQGDFGVTRIPQDLGALLSYFEVRFSELSTCTPVLGHHRILEFPTGKSDQSVHPRPDFMKKKKSASSVSSKK